MTHSLVICITLSPGSLTLSSCDSSHSTDMQMSEAGSTQRVALRISTIYASLLEPSSQHS